MHSRGFYAHLHTNSNVIDKTVYLSVPKEAIDRPWRLPQIVKVLWMDILFAWPPFCNGRRISTGLVWKSCAVIKWFTLAITSARILMVYCQWWSTKTNQFWYFPWQGGSKFWFASPDWTPRNHPCWEARSRTVHNAFPQSTRTQHCDLQFFENHRTQWATTADCIWYLTCRSRFN